MSASSSGELFGEASLVWRSLGALPFWPDDALTPDACFFLASLGRSGIAITCIFVAGMAAVIWHKTATNGWSAWWAKL